MENVVSNPAFVVYAVACLVLCANLMLLWAYSGAVRAKTKTVINPEDARSVAAGSTVVVSDPPEVARVLRAHTNTMAVFVPFAVLGLLYVLLGGGAKIAAIGFGFFVAMRLAHSVAYLSEKQPWRTLTFIASGVALIGLLGNVVYLLVTAS